MSVNAFQQNFPQQAKFEDVDGTFNVVWTNFFQSLWQRTGQGNGIIPGVQVGIVAAGNSQGTAFALTKDWNDVGTVALGAGVVMPPMQAGQDIIVFNSSATALNVYPPLGLAIDALAVNAAYSLPAGKMQVFRVLSLSQVRSTQFG